MDITYRILLSMTFVATCVGCTSTLGGREHIAAKPLSITTGQIVSARGNKKTYIGSIAFDSAAKCDNFIATLTGDQSSLNTNASIASTVLTAIGTAISPIHTAHAFSAAATITSSARDSINSNLYNKGTFAAFHSALQATYYTNLNNYLNALSATDESQIDVGVEATKLQTIHATCSLAAAESSILATIQPPQNKGNDTNTGGGAVEAAPAPPGSKTKGAVAGARIW
jgi:hypothetical protein